MLVQTVLVSGEGWYTFLQAYMAKQSCVHAPIRRARVKLGDTYGAAEDPGEARRNA